MIKVLFISVKAVLILFFLPYTFYMHELNFGDFNFGDLI